MTDTSNLPHVVLYGSPCSGFKIHGPFADMAAAMAFGEEMGEGGEFVMPVHAPPAKGDQVLLYPWDKATPLWQREFPDFPPEDMPAIPAGWEDASWHNETCPSFHIGESLRVFIDYADPAKSEYPEERRSGHLQRFSLHPLEDGQVSDKPVIIWTDDWSELLAAVAQQQQGN